MTNRIKNFIEDNIDLIEENKWDRLYKLFNSNSIFAGSDYIGEFTQVMLEAGLNPLMYLDYIPSCYLKRQDIKSFIIPKHITRIGSSAFCMTNLTSITIPDSVTHIELWVFDKCTDLTSVIIGNGVKEISAFAFYLCTKLTKIIYLGTRDEWNKINKHPEWMDHSAIHTIHCSDGDISAV